MILLETVFDCAVLVVHSVRKTDLRVIPYVRNMVVMITLLKVCNVYVLSCGNLWRSLAVHPFSPRL